MKTSWVWLVLFSSFFAASFVPCTGWSAPPEVLSIRGNKRIDNFAEAKRVARQLFRGHETTLYCGCRYYGRELNLNSCGIPPGGKRLRALEWEHVVPASKFGETLAAWKTGDDSCTDKKGKRIKGRKCAEKQSPLFRQMEADLHNLWPESGEINGARSNKPPVEKLVESGKIKTWGKCATRVDNDEFEPRLESRGIVARSYLYMNWAYDVALADGEKVRFEAWSKARPPSTWECERNQKIKKLQGNSNPFLDSSCG